MKHSALFILSAILLITCSCESSATGMDKSAEFIAYSGDFHRDIIVPQVNAWKEVSKVMYPRVCDDTETEWAAHRADSLANVLLSKSDLPKGEQLARLYEIENVVCYGMSYFSAIIGTYTNPQIAQEALSLIKDSDAEMDSLKSVNFAEPKLLTDYEASVYLNFCNFMILGTQYADGNPQFVADNIGMNQFNYACVDYLFKRMRNETQAYRYCSIINNSTFFMTFCPLAFWVAGEEFQQANQEEYMKIGGWFDAKTTPVISAVRNRSTDLLTPISDDEYSSILKQSAEYRAQLINLLTKAIVSVNYE